MEALPEDSNEYFIEEGGYGGDFALRSSHIQGTWFFSSLTDCHPTTPYHGLTPSCLAHSITLVVSYGSKPALKDIKEKTVNEAPAEVSKLILREVEKKAEIKYSSSR